MDTADGPTAAAADDSAAAGDGSHQQQQAPETAPESSDTVLAAGAHGWVLASSQYAQHIGPDRAVTLPCPDLYRRRQPYFAAPSAAATHTALSAPAMTAPSSATTAPVGAEGPASPGAAVAPKRKRKRKNKGSNGPGRADDNSGMGEYHRRVETDIAMAYEVLVRNSGVFPLPDLAECRGAHCHAASSINAAMREALQAARVPMVPQRIVLRPEVTHQKLSDLTNALVVAPSDRGLFLSGFVDKVDDGASRPGSGHTLVVPAGCEFVLGDHRLLSRSLPLLRSDDRLFDLVVADPPWENRSVGRAHGYSFLSHSHILELPVPLLIKEGTLLALWVTNRPKHINFAKVCQRDPVGLRVCLILACLAGDRVRARVCVGGWPIPHTLRATCTGSVATGLGHAPGGNLALGKGDKRWRHGDRIVLHASKALRDPSSWTLRVTFSRGTRGPGWKVHLQCSLEQPQREAASRVRPPLRDRSQAPVLGAVCSVPHAGVGLLGQRSPAATSIGTAAYRGAEVRRPLRKWRSNTGRLLLCEKRLLGGIFRFENRARWDLQRGFYSTMST